MRAATSGFCLYKSLPVPNGGMLSLNRNLEAPPPARSAPVASTLSHAVGSFLGHVALRYGPGGEALRESLRRTQRAVRFATGVHPLATGTMHFDPAAADVGMSGLTRLILANQDYEQIVQTRRRNWFLLFSQLRDVAPPVQLELPPGACPLFYPLIVDDKARVAERLAARGIETIEFWNQGHPACDVGQFPEVATLRRRVLELPLHQDLHTRGHGLSRIGRGGAVMRVEPSRATNAALSPVRVLESEDPARLAALGGEWRELFQSGGGVNPFLSWEWQYTFWRAFAQRRPIWILEARDRTNRLVGLLVLTAKGGLTGARHWWMLTNGLTGADALDILVRPGFGSTVRDAIAHAVAAGLQRWDFLDLEDLPCGTATVAAFRSALQPRGVKVEVEPRFACPGFALSGTFAAHLAGFKRRETYQRRRRWLEKQPGYRIEVVSTPGEAPAAMEDFLRLHHLRWDVEGGSDGIPRGRVEEFHRDMAPLVAARGWLRLYRLMVDGRSIAAVYGLELGRRFYYYQSGMDPAWSARSPGLVLIGKTIEDAYARKLTDYDFLRGTEPHKLDWATDRRETCALRLRAPGLRPEAEAAAAEVFRRARNAAKAIAPEGMWSTLRRVRRDFEVSGVAGVQAGFAAHAVAEVPAARPDGEGA